MRFFRTKNKKFYLSPTFSEVSGERAPHVFYVAFANEIVEKLGLSGVEFSAEYDSYNGSEIPEFINVLTVIATSRAQEWVNGEPYGKCVAKALEEIARNLVLRLDVMQVPAQEENEPDADAEAGDSLLTIAPDKDPWEEDESSLRLKTTKRK